MDKIYDERIATTPEQEAEMKQQLDELMNPAPVIATLRAEVERKDARITELEAALGQAEQLAAAVNEWLEYRARPALAAVVVQRLARQIAERYGKWVIAAAALKRSE